MNLSGYEKLMVDLKDRVLRITLNAPDKRNIVGAQMSRELSRVFSEASMSADVAVIVLTGAGKAFSAGGDIVAMQEKIDNPALFYEAIGNARRLFFSMIDCSKPVVGRINGDAIGLGATLTLLCDITVINEEAKIGDPHVKVGLVAGDGGALLWSNLIGLVRARQYLLSGELMTAREALNCGLVNFAEPLDRIDEVVDRWIAMFAAGATQSISGTKLLLNLGLRQAAQAALDVGMAYEGLSNVTEDHQEAVHAFMQKRKPVFTGK